MKPCKKCGGFERYENGACRLCARERSSKWNAANSERMKANLRRYYVANKETLKAASALRHYECHDRVIATKRRRYTANREKVMAENAKWRAKNPTAVRVIKSRYRANRRGASVPLTLEEQAKVIALYAKARELTKLTCKTYHVDHIRPLAKGGLHHPNNLQVLLGSENCRKGARV